MKEDPIVAKLRQVRHAHAEKLNNDVAAIFEETRRQEKESGRQYVSYPPRRIEGLAPTQKAKRRKKRARM